MFGNSRSTRSRNAGPLAGSSSRTSRRGGLFRKNRPSKTTDMKTFVDPHAPPKRRTEARRRLGLGNRAGQNAPMPSSRKAPLSVRIRSMFRRNGTRTTRTPAVGRTSRSRNPFSRRR